MLDKCNFIAFVNVLLERCAYCVTDKRVVITRNVWIQNIKPTLLNLVEKRKKPAYLRNPKRSTTLHFDNHSNRGQNLGTAPFYKKTLKNPELCPNYEGIQISATLVKDQISDGGNRDAVET